MHNYIGYLTAENQVERDEILPQAFIKTSSIENALDDSICFVCGRRGAGKTAVVTMIDRLKNVDGEKIYDCSLCLKEDDYKELHLTFVEELVYFYPESKLLAAQLELIFYHIWRYILDIMLFQAANKLINSSVTDKSKEYILSKYLEDQFKIGNSAPNIALSLVIDKLNTSRSMASPLTHFTLECKNLRQKSEHLSSLEIVSKIFDKFRAVLTIDTEERYDLTDHRIYPMRGMCRAIKEFKFDPKFQNVSVKCCLPAEITDDLFQENLAKYNENAVYLLWTYGDLLEFLARRYIIFLKSQDGESIKLADELSKLITPKKNAHKNDYWFKNFWCKICPEKIYNRFKWPENSAAYLIRHTQKRPREIICCMDYIIDSSIDQGSFPYISELSIKEGIHNDMNLYQLLSDNLSIFNLPRREGNIAAIASEIMVDENTVFSGAYFSRFAKRALSILSTKDTIDQPEYAKKILLRSGLLGRVRRHRDGPIHKWKEPGEERECKYYVTEFEYLIPGWVAINDSSLCAVHPILSDRLSLMPPPGDEGVVYPIPENKDLVSQLNEMT